MEDKTVQSRFISEIKGESLSILYYDYELSEFSQVTKSSESDKTGSSDIISGVYEGGLKIWEGSIILIQYLSQLEEEEKQQFYGK
jgi:hypothetical protein